MTRALRVFAPVGLAVIAVGTSTCSVDGSGPEELSTARETISGVDYVTHTGSLQRSQLELVGRIGSGVGMGGASSPEEFGRVESVIGDASGSIYVADGIALDIRKFGPDGQFLRRMGGEGQGPGEIGGLHGIAWLNGDTIIVMDFGNARLGLIEASGEVAGQWPWLRLTGPGPFLFNGGPGEVYVHTLRSPRQGDEGLRSAWVRYTEEGPKDTLDIPRTDPRPGSQAICRGDGIGFMENPFGDRLISRPAPGLERVVAWASGYRLAFIDAAGDTLRVISRDVGPTPLADSSWHPVDSSYTRFRSMWAGAECEGSISRPDSRPVLLDLTFDHQGRLLVEYNTHSGAAYDLLDTDGSLSATFSSPPDRDRSVAPFLRGDRMYVVAKDRFDVQEVRAYRVTDGNIR